MQRVFTKYSIHVIFNFEFFVVGFDYNANTVCIEGLVKRERRLEEIKLDVLRSLTCLTVGKTH